MMQRAYWKSDRLMKFQNKQLRNVVRYAYDNVPFYHRKFRELGLKPADIANSEDLARFPITTKKEIRENLHDMISREFKIQELKGISTSGSTGQPLFLKICEAEDELRKAKHLRANISCGQKIRDRWIVITSPHHFGVSTKLQRVIGVYVPTPVSVFYDVSTQALTIEKMNPDILDGYSSSILLLAKEVEREGLRTIKPRFTIGGAELIDDSSRRLVEKVFSVPFYDQYSCIEFNTISWQCPEKVGYHTDIDSLVVQFVDNDGEVVNEGSGEVVCTSLFNHAMPLIRYAIGDIGVQSNDECPCGRTLPLMKMIEGRKDSLLILSDGRILSPRTFTIAMSMFKYYAQFDQFRIVQKKIDSFQVRIKMKKNNVDEGVVERELIAYLRNVLCLSTDVASFDIEFVDDFSLDRSGKFKIVESSLPQSFFRGFS